MACSPPYLGATYFNTRAKIEGHFDVPLPDSNGQTGRINYQIDEKVTGNWSGLVGAHWMPVKSISLLAEVGDGYYRNNVILTGFYRF